MKNSSLLTYILAGVAVVILIFVAVANLRQNPPDNSKQNSMENSEEIIADEELSDDSPENMEDSELTTYQGKPLSTGNSPYLEFTQADYEKALKEGKVIVLDFYANWCPTCRAEEPKIIEGFKLLNDARAVGFRVNYKDNNTDDAERKLADQFKIPYQHTKVILVNGVEFSRDPLTWSAEDVVTEVNKALEN